MYGPRHRVFLNNGSLCWSLTACLSDRQLGTSLYAGALVFECLSDHFNARITSAEQKVLLPCGNSASD